VINKKPTREFHESPFVVRSGELWDRATQATFLTAVANGTLPEDPFRRWSVQDYHFAKGVKVAETRWVGHG
jgi:thiaminase